MGPQSIALAVEAKNSPPDYFFNASTVLKEIVSQTNNAFAKSKGVFIFARRANGAMWASLPTYIFIEFVGRDVLDAPKKIRESYALPLILVFR